MACIVIKRLKVCICLYLGLSDALASFVKPNVCDLTMGTISYRPNCPREKQLREEFKYAWRRTIGFFISGMQIYDPDKEVFVKFTRQVCRSLTPDEVYDKAISRFLGFDHKHRMRLAAAYLTKLDDLSRWVECYGFSSVTFCRTSLLLGHESTSISSDTVEVVVRLIDFTDWAEISPDVSSQSDNSPESELITGFAHGLSVLMGMLTRAIRSHAVVQD
ncbi:unnamed protein product [Dicrocoelium dendriticum]|nr:unnamed protein product [Dicrocoelium dendriticum]